MKRFRSSHREALLVDGLWVYKFNVRCPVQDAQEDHFHIKARQMIAQAKMGTPTEGDVSIWIPRHIEVVCCRECIRTPVG